MEMEQKRLMDMMEAVQELRRRIDRKEQEAEVIAKDLRDLHRAKGGVTRGMKKLRQGIKEKTIKIELKKREQAARKAAVRGDKLNRVEWLTKEIKDLSEWRTALEAEIKTEG